MQISCIIQAKFSSGRSYEGRWKERVRASRPESIKTTSGFHLLTLKLRFLRKFYETPFYVNHHLSWCISCSEAVRQVTFYRSGLKTGQEISPLAWAVRFAAALFWLMNIVYTRKLSDTTCISSTKWNGILRKWIGTLKEQHDIKCKHMKNDKLVF